MKDKIRQENTDAAGSVSPELRFLLAESRLHPAETDDRKALSLFSGGLDFSLLNGLAIRNRLHPVFAANLRRLQLPPDTFRPVLKASDGCRLCSMTAASELARIFRIFRESGIRALSLKGPLLAQQIYGNIALRASRDLDILVEPEKYCEARQLLLKDGYQPADLSVTEKQLRYLMKTASLQHTVLQKNGFYVELHWKSADLEPLSFEKLYQRADRQTFCGAEICVPGETDCFCLLIRHGVHHGFSRLRWLMDLYELFSAVSDETLQKVSSELTECRSFFTLLTVLLLLDRFGLIPVETADSPVSSVHRKQNGTFRITCPLSEPDLQAAETLSRAAAVLITETDPDRIHQLEESYAALRKAVHCRLGLNDRKANLVEAFSPRPQEFELVRLPDSLFFLYYPLRILYWLFRKVRPGKD